MSMRPLMPLDRPIRYLPERRRGLKNGRHDPTERRHSADPRRGHADTLADEIAQTLFAHRLGLYTALLVTISLIIQLAGPPWEWFN